MTMREVKKMLAVMAPATTPALLLLWTLVMLLLVVVVVNKSLSVVSGPSSVFPLPVGVASEASGLSVTAVTGRPVALGT